MENTAPNSTMQNTNISPNAGMSQPAVANTTIPKEVNAQQPVVANIPADTAQTQATIPTSSTAPTVDENTVPDINTESSAERLAELRKNLDALLESGNSNSEPIQQPVVSTEPTTQVENTTPIQQEVALGGSSQSSAPVGETYKQTVTDLPNLNTVTNFQQDEDISKIIESQPMEESIPVANSIDTSALSRLMPEEKKPKAIDRVPKENNLAKPNISTDNVSTESDVLTSSNEGTQQKPKGELTMSKLLSEAITQNASDLHISVGYPPILRIDGGLVDMDEKVLTPEDVENLIFSVLTDEKKELLEVNREIDFAYLHAGSVTARFRVNAYYTMKNLAAAFRLIPTRIRTIEELSLPPIYHQITQLKQGLVLVTGPTGHGKSTTLAAMLEDVNRTRFVHMVTIEDPIEYVFEGKKALIDQREMNDDTHSWPIALRSALRQDPDVILVGEMRDYETIASAITLAETGHLVFATLHTNSAAQTVDRIIDVFPENQQQQIRSQVANSLRAVIAQRLIPLDKGGRRAVSEIMINNSALANLIREGKTHQIDNIIRTSADVGMIYLEKSLVALVREGVISVQKAQEYAVHPEEVLRLLKG